MSPVVLTPPPSRYVPRVGCHDICGCPRLWSPRYTLSTGRLPGYLTPPASGYNYIVRMRWRQTYFTIGLPLVFKRSSVVYTVVVIFWAPTFRTRSICICVIILSLHAEALLYRHAKTKGVYSCVIRSPPNSHSHASHRHPQTTVGSAALT